MRLLPHPQTPTTIALPTIPNPTPRVKKCWCSSAWHVPKRCHYVYWCPYYMWSIQPGVCRRGAKEADELILELVRIADAVRGDANKHMAHEEQEVLPLLEAHLCAAEQRAMVWRTLRAMPLRLLERVMPWVAGKCPLASFAWSNRPRVALIT